VFCYRSRKDTKTGGNKFYSDLILKSYVYSSFSEIKKNLQIESKKNLFIYNIEQKWTIGEQLAFPMLSGKLIKSSAS
jgi:hypothetical protein